MRKLIVLFFVIGADTMVQVRQRKPNLHRREMCRPYPNMDKTREQYLVQEARCAELFFHKMDDYGSAWRILRTTSLTDQVFIKAQRIRTLEETGESKVNEGIEDEFVGIVNYSIMALIQLRLKGDSRLELTKEEARELYSSEFEVTRELMLRKNHDYGEAWREMRVSSFTDLILMKLLRIKQIEDNSGRTKVSEGVDSGYRDIVNYAMFALIRMNEPQGQA